MCRQKAVAIDWRCLAPHPYLLASGAKGRQARRSACLGAYGRVLAPMDESWRLWTSLGAYGRDVRPPISALKFAQGTFCACQRRAFLSIDTPKSNSERRHEERR